MAYLHLYHTDRLENERIIEDTQANRLPTMRRDTPTHRQQGNLLQEVDEIGALVQTCTHCLLGFVSCGVIFRSLGLFYNPESTLRVK
jgi:hypothetical protein